MYISTVKAINDFVGLATSALKIVCMLMWKNTRHIKGNSCQGRSKAHGLMDDCLLYRCSTFSPVSQSNLSCSCCWQRVRKSISLDALKTHLSHFGMLSYHAFFSISTACVSLSCSIQATTNMQILMWFIWSIGARVQCPLRLNLIEIRIARMLQVWNMSHWVFTW